VTLKTREAIQPDVLRRINGVSEVSAVDKGLRLRLTGDFDPLLRAISPYYIEDLRVQEPTLEEIFLAYYDDHRNGNGQRVAEGQRKAELVR
jgi:ABC-2 type transport system ATP-binding protein